uniref:Protein DETOXIFICATION n=1 Tax=Tetradesmus obliquus TaxID=3088 RepID=A0A383V4G4_TETOB|eukprot:jgi/Sobl393_1/6859/SZX60498.1
MKCVRRTCPCPSGWTTARRSLIPLRSSPSDAQGVAAVAAAAAAAAAAGPKPVQAEPVPLPVQALNPAAQVAAGSTVHEVASASSNGTTAGSSSNSSSSKHSSSNPSSPSSSKQQRSRHKVTQYLVTRDLSRVWRLAGPLMANNMAGYALSIIGAIFIGQLGALSLSSSVLANSVYNCTGLSLALGLSAGMETLCGQAYGAGAYTRLSVIFQRALLVCWTVCIPVALLWLNSHALLLQLGQQPDIAALASRYLVLCTPCLFLTTAMECTRRYLQAQRAVKPTMAVGAATLAASPFIFWAFMVKAQLGLDGAALAFISCQLLTLLGLLSCVAWRAVRMEGKREQTWGGWSNEAFADWPEYMKYGLPAAAMISLEWWAYEVILILAGLLPNAEVALSTMGVCLNINAWMYMLPLGLGAAVNTSIGNAMGAGHAATAKRAFLGGIASGAFLQAALSLSISLWGRHLVALFTNDPAVIASCCSVLPLLAGLVFFDGVNAVVGGCLRGAGRQMLGAAINFIGYWVVGVPLAAWLAFRGGMGIHGFWWGVAAGAAVQAVVLLALLLRWDWQREVERVQGLLRQAAASGKVAPSFGH